MKYMKLNAGCIYPGVLDGDEGHAPKSCCPLYAVHSLYRGNLKNIMPRSFTFVCQLYWCSSKCNDNKALRITFNSCKTVSTSNMALATVNIDKIIKVTSASSYVYCGCLCPDRDKLMPSNQKQAWKRCIRDAVDVDLISK